MFTNTTFKKFNIAEKEKLVGKIEVNDILVSKTKFDTPITRETSSKMITKVGDRDYEKLQKFIIDCMKNYYEKMMSASTNSEKNRMLTTYTHLYEMWKELYNAKKSNNIVEKDKMYDLFSYELYVLGYNE